MESMRTQFEKVAGEYRGGLHLTAGAAAREPSYRLNSCRSFWKSREESRSGSGSTKVFVGGLRHFAICQDSKEA